jgi:hypothetical protein
MDFIGGEGEERVATTGHTSNNLIPNGQLTLGQYLHSDGGSYRLFLQSDGNLVLRRISDSKALWASGTNGKSVTRFVFQSDGNLTLKTAAGTVVWNSNTAGSGATKLVLNTNGSLVLYRNSTVVWSVNGSAPADQCPNDPNKTEPGVCGCGVPEGSCGGTGTGIKHIATTRVYDPNGQGLTISRPSGSLPGDLLILVLHRTDDDLPVYVSGWNHIAECYKSDNGQDCRGVDRCASWHNSNFCQYFGTDTWRNPQGQWVRYEGHDLAQSILYKVVGSNESSSYSFNLNRDSTGHPSWAFLTALRGAASTDPVRDWENEGCDGSSASVFPSVYGQKGDMLLLSQSFDDAVAASKFGAPSGMSTFGYVTGERQYVSAADQNSNLTNDETGFLFGSILTTTGETGAKRTVGDGASSCKDVLVSLVIKAK